MPRRKNLKMEKYGLSVHRVNELQEFCLQYSDKLAQIRWLEGLTSSGTDGMPHASGTTDPTSSKADRCIALRRDVDIIEQAAISAAPGYYQYMIRCVTRGVPYDILLPPCGRNQFNEARHKFFWLLDKNR